MANGGPDYKLLAIVAIPIILIFTVVVYVFFLKDDSPRQQSAPGSAIPIPQAKTEEQPKSKVDAYLQKKKREDAARAESKNAVKTDDFYSLAVTDNPSPQTPAVTTEVSPEPETVPQRKPRPRKKESAEEEPKPVQSPPQPSYSSGFGVVRGTSSASSNNPIGVSSGKENHSSSQGYFSVLLEETLTIKNNTNIVFVLTQDIWFEGKKINKNSYFFGKAKEKQQIFDVEIYEIKNTDGSVLDMRGKNFFLFDEKYSRGLAHEGNINEATKDAARESTSEEISSISNPNVSAVNTALNIMEKGVQKMTRKKENSVALQKGYRLFVKQDINTKN